MKYTYFQKKNIMKNMKLFKSNSKFNHYDVNKGESEEHDKEVCLQFFELRRRGHFLAIRQKLENGQIPDIAVLDLPDLVCKEILKSETKERFEQKAYPGKKIGKRLKK